MEDKEIQEIREKFKNQITPELKESFQKLSDRMTAYNDKNQKEFKKTFKTVKHILKSRKLVLPRDWQKVFYEWYVEKYRDEINELTWDDLTEKMKDESIIFEWAESYPKELIPEKIEVEKTERGEPIAVRYSILNEFFNESDQFKNLSEKQKEQILAYILGTIPRTAKGIKNGEPKYFSDGHKSRAKELINKIKKGDIL
ncbi:hypothetical protein [Cecembia rubra]|uniref:hypothetical protein n=1 Tax=Cecembia rubra TaxID=1485585 RepID=UPI002714D80A|nr:hypothetical protein [Cecembia rubra]